MDPPDAGHDRGRALLASLYGEEIGRRVLAELETRLRAFTESHPAPPRRELTEQDAVLVTYGDQFREPGVPPLEALRRFCESRLTGLVNTIHLLPFHPYTSDDGFSVTDYGAVDPALGDWSHIERLGRRFRLMLDAVVNHTSASHPWFRGYLQDDPRYRRFFITADEEADLSAVVRPRTSPLLTRFASASSERRVWTTFSADQVDLDYHDPAVLLQMIDVLLQYVARGASLLRLDAIAYVWKEPGTPCVHLPQAHAIVQLFRWALDLVAPDVRLVTETNVPHAENISYFGDGTDEAQLVYNFALPVLVLHAIHAANARKLSRWAAALSTPSTSTAFLNFLASHDGIGLNGARGILDEDEIAALVTRTRRHSGLVSYRRDPGGGESPYELNINYFDAVSAPSAAERVEVQVRRFMVTQAIMLALAGVPAIYVHSLAGSRGWPAGVEQGGQNRAINREKLWRPAVEEEMDRPGTLRHRVFRACARLLRARRRCAAFHPGATQGVLDLDPGLFALRRSGRDGVAVLCVHNVTPHRVDVAAPLPAAVRDLVSGRAVTVRGGLLRVPPYGVLWLVEDG